MLTLKLLLLDTYLLSVLFFMASFKITMDNGKNKAISEDPFEAMREMQESLDKIEDDNVREWMINFTDRLLSDRYFLFMFIFLVAVTPAINLLAGYSFFKSNTGRRVG